MYFDTHVHFDGITGDRSPESILQEAGQVGVGYFLAVGGAAHGNALAVELAEKFPDRIHAAVGFDRDEAGEGPSLAELDVYLQHPSVVAIGETGLDYYYSPETADAQKRLFSAQLEKARETGKPVIVHSRAADSDTLQILEEHRRLWRGDRTRLGVLHCFTGDAPFAERLLGMDLFISFSGILTFKTAEALREVAAKIPDERLLIETDSPYLAPVPHRGERNEPAYVVRVAEALAALRKTSVEHIARITCENAEYLFGIKRKEPGP